MNQSNARVEEWLDRGYGECWLSHSEVAQVVQETLLEGNQSDFGLQAWVIMSNHAHVAVEIWNVPLAKLVNHWKGKSSREANKLLGRSGQFWQKDYFDSVLRDAEHVRKATRYTEENPVKAFLVETARGWKWGSARYRDQWQRLCSKGEAAAGVKVAV